MQGLDALLRRLGVSQRELARRSGLRSQTISHIAKGGGCLHDTFVQIRAALEEEGHLLNPDALTSLAYQKGETEPQKRLRAMRVPDQPDQVPTGAAS